MIPLRALSRALANAGCWVIRQLGSVGACGLWLLGDLAVVVDCRFLCCVAGLLGSLGLWVLAGFGCWVAWQFGFVGACRLRLSGSLGSWGLRALANAGCWVIRQLGSVGACGLWLLGDLAVGVDGCVWLCVVISCWSLLVKGDQLDRLGRRKEVV